jgi:hypothetical protein
MRTIKLSLNKITILLFFVVLTLSACKKGPVTPPQKTCEHKGYFEEMKGFEGYYNGYIIRLENGTILFPCLVEDKSFDRNSVYDGMPITVSYERLQEEIACKVPYWYTVEDHKEMSFGCFEYMRAKITCIGGDEQTRECGNVGFCGTEL